MNKYRLALLILFSSIKTMAQTASGADAGISAVVSPQVTALACTATWLPKAVVHNYGTKPITSVQIFFRLDNGVALLQNWTGNLLPQQNDSVQLTGFLAQWGAHTFDAYTAQPNNTADGFPSNDTTHINFNVAAGAAAIPYFEGFEGPTFPPPGWTNDAGQYKWDTTSAAAFSGQHCIMAPDWWGSRGYTYNLTMPAVDLTSVTGVGKMTFQLSYSLFAPPFYLDSLEVLASADCGNSWTSLYVKGDTQLATYPFNGWHAPNNIAQWRLETVNLQAFDGNPFVQLRFANHCRNGNDIYVDDINIFDDHRPIPKFSIQPDTICLNTATPLNNLTTMNPASFYWDMPGGIPYNSILQNPTVSYATTGIHQIILTAFNSFGWQTDTETVYVRPAPVPLVYINGQDLITSPYYAAYQWLENGNVIVGATSSLYTYTENGRYKVAIRDTMGCLGESLEYTFTGLAVNPVGAKDVLQVYPNPAHEFINLHLASGKAAAASLTIRNTLGAVVLSTSFYGADFRIDTRHFPAGIYEVQVQQAAQLLTKRIIIQ